MKEFNKNVNITPYSIGNTKEVDLTRNIYKKMMEDLNEYMKVQEGHTINVLDCFARESFVNELQLDWMTYKSTDPMASYLRDNTNYVIDYPGSPNQILAKDNEFAIIFTVGNKSFFGETHEFLMQVERLLQPGGLLIVAVSKYLFYKELNQTLVATRPGFEYLRAVEVGYQITESGTDSSKFFTFYRYKG